uniref:Reelin domain-containing protein n=1 Tax=Steinernema glaseri TaxID=37863 RepID=A0A1I8AW04_9BILA
MGTVLLVMLRMAGRVNAKGQYIAVRHGNPCKESVRNERFLWCLNLSVGPGFYTILVVQVFGDILEDQAIRQPSAGIIDGDQYMIVTHGNPEVRKESAECTLSTTFESSFRWSKLSSDDF